MLLVTLVNLVDSLVKDIKAYCLVITEILADQMIVWYQATTSLSDTAALSSSAQLSAHTKLVTTTHYAHCTLTLETVAILPNTPAAHLGQGLELTAVLSGQQGAPGQVHSVPLYGHGDGQGHGCLYQD